MERTKGKAGESSEPKFRWKVIASSGFHGLNHRIYKPNEIFTATEAEVPTAFRDVIIKMDSVSVQEQEAPIPGVQATYTLKESAEKGNAWDVVNQHGKVINEKPLSIEKAEKLIKDLSE